MKVKKFISIALLSSLFFNNMTNSFAGILSQDGRYETFEGNNIGIANILDNESVDIEIDGQTLVNHAKFSHIYQNVPWITYNGSYATFTNPQEASNISFKLTGLKPSTEYTLIFNVANVFTNGDVLRYDLFPDTYEELGAINSLGIKRHKFTTDSDLSTLESFRFYVPAARDGVCKVSNPIIIEGDWTNKDIPNDFEGLSSVAQEESNNIIMHKGNKNLFDIELWKNGEISEHNLVNYSWSGDDICITANYEDSFLETGIIVENQTLFNKYQSRYAIKVEPNTKYTLSFKRDGYAPNYTSYINLLDESYNFISLMNISFGQGKISYTFTTTSNTQYVTFRLGVQGIGNTVRYSNIQLEKGSTATSYVKHSTEILTIPLSEPLRSLPNGVKDKIIKKDGQWVVKRSVGERVFDGSEGWLVHRNLTSDEIVYFVLENRHKTNVSINANLNNTKNNIVPDVSRGYLSLNANHEGLSMHSSGGDISWYSLAIKKSKLSDNTVSALKGYLANSPMTVLYPLEKIIYEPLSSSLSIDLPSGNTHLYINSTIPFDMKVTVDRVANRAEEAIKLVDANPIVENISQARYWVNLMKDSILKDSFQNSINSCTDIKDLTIDKKIVSANSDVYIKLKNTLSISLDTNNITFEDVDSTEDVEIKNAVNLTISSSLPYKINAYLEDEIYNSDKTATLDKSTLNIKMSNDNDYKAFINATDPIVLLDSQTEDSDITYGLDFMLSGGSTYKADIYKAVIKLEVEQK